MKKAKADLIPECPVAATIALIGNKWKLLIMRNLLARPWRFNELQKSLDGVSHKVLTDCLRSMEEDGIVVRTVLEETPLKVEYSLSELGESMRPILDSMKAWGDGVSGANEKTVNLLNFRRIGYCFVWNGYPIFVFV